MKSEMEVTAAETAALIDKFIARYVDRAKIPNRILLWNSLKEEVRTECHPFSSIRTRHFFAGKTVFVYDEREKILRKTKWTEIVRSISRLEPWEENVDLLLFDESLDWFAAITHEDLLTVCAGTLISKESSPASACEIPVFVKTERKRDRFEGNP